jgi:hypothetical protein
VVHGVTGSGSGTRRAAPAAVRAHVERTAPPPSFSATTTPQSQHSLSSAAGSVSGVAGGFESAVGGSPTTPTSDSAKAVATPSVGNGGRLQHTDASLVVRVPDVERLSHATSAATQVATALGGYAQSVVYRTPKAGGGESYLELRVPAQNVQRALARLGQLGTIVSQQVSVQDLEHALEQQSAEIAQLERTVAALQQALRDPALPDAQRVLLRIKLAETRRALSQRRHARTGTIAAGTTARVSLVLETKEAVVPVPHHRGRLGRMVHSAVGFLGLEATIALYALIVVGPLLVVAALAWGLSRARRRRDERRLLAA